MSSTQSTRVEKQWHHTACCCGHGEWSLPSDGLGQYLLEALKSLHPGWASTSWRLWNPSVQAGSVFPGGSEIPPSIKLSRYLSTHVILNTVGIKAVLTTEHLLAVHRMLSVLQILQQPHERGEPLPTTPQVSEGGDEQASMTTELDLRVPRPMFS